MALLDTTRTEFLECEASDSRSAWVPDDSASEVLATLFARRRCYQRQNHFLDFWEEGRSNARTDGSMSSMKIPSLKKNSTTDGQSEA